MTSVNEYGKWVKLGQELGLETTELRQFVMERQAEQKAERDKEAALAEKIRQSEKEEKIRLAEIESARLREEKELAKEEKIRQDELAQAEKIRQTEIDEKRRADDLAARARTE